MPYANNKGADQPAHLHSLFGTFVVCCLDSIIPLVSISEISSLCLAFVVVQASLRLTWSQTPKDRLSCDKAHVCFICNGFLFLNDQPGGFPWWFYAFAHLITSSIWEKLAWRAVKANRKNLWNHCLTTRSIWQSLCIFTHLIHISIFKLQIFT